MSIDGEPRRVSLDTTARRARRLLSRQGGSSVENANGGGQEATQSRSGPPGEADRNALTRIVTRSLGNASIAGVSPGVQAEAVAADLVERAQQAMQKLEGGAPESSLPRSDLLALEAVIHTRGRPAVRVIADGLEDLATYPGASIWENAVDLYRKSILSVCGATAAVRVKDTLAPNFEWIQGTAWPIAPNLVITNRHVLFPPLGGMNLARRIPGTTQARIKADLSVLIDFAFDNGVDRTQHYRIKDVPFVASERDPIDAAVLEVERVAGPEVTPLKLSRDDPFDLTRLYIVGHPGRMDSIPDAVRAVFGDPDERKRVSFGELMDPETADPTEVVHDASTIGGYSGGCVIGISSPNVRALHYWGDAIAGNRAITAAALRRHEVLGRMIPESND